MHMWLGKKKPGLKKKGGGSNPAFDPVYVIFKGGK